jgi:hypothetical protein
LQIIVRTKIQRREALHADFLNTVVIALSSMAQKRQQWALDKESVDEQQFSSSAVSLVKKVVIWGQRCCALVGYRVGVDAGTLRTGRHGSKESEARTGWKVIGRCMMLSGSATAFWK